MATVAAISLPLCAACGGTNNDHESEHSSLCKNCASDLAAIVTQDEGPSAGGAKFCVTCSQALDASYQQVQCHSCLEVAFEFTPEKESQAQNYVVASSSLLNDDGVETLKVRSPGSLLRERFQKAQDNGQVIELLLSEKSSSSSSSDECVIIDVISPGTSLKRKFEEAAQQGNVETIISPSRTRLSLHSPPAGTVAQRQPPAPKQKLSKGSRIPALNECDSAQAAKT